MKFSISLVSLALTLTVCCQLVTSLPQRSAFGNEDINKYLSNPKYVEQQLDCVLDRAGCDSVGRNLKGMYHILISEMEIKVPILRNRNFKMIIGT